MLNLNWVVVSTSLLISLGVQAGSVPPTVFSFRAEVPAAGTCVSNAQSVARLFQKATGATVTGSACMGQNTVNENGVNYSRDVVRVDYLSDRELVLKKAIFGDQEFMGTASPDSGLFLTYGECLKQLPTQKVNFETQTGLTSVVAYCETEATYQSATYALVIEGFGASQRQLYLHTNSTPDPALSQAQLKVITDGGGAVVLTDPSHIFYYNSQPITVNSRTFGFFSAANQCTDQLNSAAAIYTRAGVGSVTALCLSNNELIVVYAFDMSVQEYISNGDPLYSSYSDCMIDEPRVLQNYTSTGGKPLGIICGVSPYSRGQFVAHLFYKSGY